MLAKVFKYPALIKIVILECSKLSIKVGYVEINISLVKLKFSNFRKSGVAFIITNQKDLDVLLS